MYTSGTVGLPQPVVLHVADDADHLEAIARRIR